MITHAQVSTVKPNLRFHGQTLHISPLHESPSIALSDPHWQYAMYDEYNVLIKNDTWILVSKPPNVNVVRSMWLFRHKYHVDGSLSRYKARLVANGCNEQYGVDCSHTFSLVFKLATIHTVLSLALTQNWPVHQLDVKNTFLNGDLSETIYMYQPYGFVDPQRVHISNCNATRTSVDMESKLGYNRDPVFDPILYHSLAGGLQYLTFTRAYISYDVQEICLYMHDPREPHLAALNRVLRYVHGTSDFGLQLYASSTSSLVVYPDAD
ncbi:ribonuclease H-like domain-containing protein [Tanacetum coccineum]